MSLFAFTNPFSCAGDYLLYANSLEEAKTKALAQLNRIHYKGKDKDKIVDGVHEVKPDDNGVIKDFAQVG